ncbi:MAG: tRNA 2-selenouridine(34) synthase MnmH [Peptoniphilus sp.]|nr:tRNA 2-selenouridine(34) synthase MnmH [Peptoniphilus sp.]MDD7363007.1 tRNA 2-selenouridine(34) synthase MnmH [Bacillota bacterium]MDY6045272.1 tRNA 2-selenouridine(34) synthase MnmH [Peptoniphilus sp.]
MNKEILYEDIKTLDDPILIDLRSPSEHRSHKIIGSVNMPILNDEERKIVGTLYDSGEILESKKRAVAFASGKLPKLFDFIADQSAKRDVVLYCSRGGYRSTALFYFLNSMSIETFKLKGGYKSYRKYVMRKLDEYAERSTFVDLNGYTGVGKTKILSELKALGANVLDLEGLARHRGSLLGNLERRAQPSQKDFEAMIVEAFESFRGDVVFVESESHKIGDLFVPKVLHDAYYKKGIQVLITLPVEERVKNIRDEYVDYDEAFRASLTASLDELGRFIGKKRVRKYREYIDAGDYDEIIEDLIENYYDISYKTRKSGFKGTIENTSPEASAKKLFDAFVAER